jgi:hypothetical protein
MKKRLFAIVTVIFLFAASINAMVINFGKGEVYEGTLYPIIFNPSVVRYYDNNTKESFDAYLLYFLLKVDSKNLNPFKAHAYIKINDNITKNMEYSIALGNAYPYYLNAYEFTAKIFPQEFSFNYDKDGYDNMLNLIDNVTFFLEYDNKTFSYSFSDFTKYADYLKNFNHSLGSLDVNNFPVISWEGNDNISNIGVSLYIADSNNWNDPNTQAAAKILPYTKAIFANWYYGDNVTKNIDISEIPNLIIPGLRYIAKIKNSAHLSKDNSQEAHNIINFQAVYKKIPDNIIKPITNASGWHLLSGMGFDVFMDFIGGFFQLNKVITIWTWNNNSWSIWSPDENIMKLISNYGLKTLSIIYRNQGIWVNLK